MTRARWLCLVWCLFGFGLGLLIGSATCHAQATPTPAVAPLNPAAPPAAKGQDCHFNANNQLVCRHCWVDAGRVRCGKPRIVKQQEPPSN